MNKQLLDQVQKAMKAQQDTIERQQVMLEQRQQDIQHLQKLLERLAKARIEQLQQLPELHKQLQNTISEQEKQQIIWLTQVTKQMQLMNQLTAESSSLAERQIRLIESMKEYQKALALDTNLTIDLTQLQSELDELATSQTKITNSQKSLKNQQEHLQKLLQTSK